MPVAILRVHMLGQLHIQRGKETVTALLPPRLQELFCYLVLFRDRPHPREGLASLLWSDSSTAQSRRNLRQALWQLQRSSAFKGIAGQSELLLVDSRWIQLNQKADLWLDVEALDHAYSRSEGVSGQALDPLQILALHDAVELYKGDLLDGCFQDWCLYERERIQNIYLTLLDKLMEHCEICGQYEAGLAYAYRALQCDGARERTYRRLMRLHALAGDRSAALRQYDLCVAALRRELDVAPSDLTVGLYQQIRKGQFHAMPLSPQPLDRQGGPPRSQWTDLLGQLREMKQELDRLQAQLDAAIRKAELVGSRDPEHPMRRC